MTQFQAPLDWPQGWPRAKRRTRARFDSRRSPWAAGEGLDNELRRLGAREIVITTGLPVRVDGRGFISNAPKLNDPGAACYFKVKERPTVLACDAWERVESNLHALALHVGSIRGQERWGVGTIEQAFTGYTALSPSNGKPWWFEPLGIDTLVGLTEEDVGIYFRAAAPTAHPDTGGTNEEFDRLIKAREAALAHLKG